MCGLSGCAGNIGYREEKAFKSLLVFSTVRGDDATGVGAVTRNKIGDFRRMSLAKELGPFPFLFDTHRFEELFRGVNDKSVYMGHNRSKTVGENTRRNAHPFMFEDIMGTHNGTIDFQNKNRMEKGSEFRTDSEAIFYNVQCKGIEDTIGKIEDTEAYALVWYDRRDHTINFIRNDKRPLIYVLVNDGTTLFWASEYELLAAALLRDGYKIPDKFQWLSPDTWLKFEIPDNNNQKFAPPVKKHLSGMKPKSYNYSGGYRHGFTGGSGAYDVSTPADNCKKNTVSDATNDTATTSGYDENGVWQSHLDDQLDMEWGGHYVGMVPKKKTSDLAVHERAAQAVIDAGKAILKGTKQATTPPNIMTVNDVQRKMALARAENLHIKPDSTKYVLVYTGTTLVVYRDKESNEWVSLRWSDGRKEFDRYNSTEPPLDIPYSILDLNGRHEFEHRGKKKKKVIYYKGYSGTLLDRDRFEKIMQQGCTNCERKPEWGNKVTFVSKNHDFLCEYCAMKPNLVEVTMQLFKENDATSGSQAA